MYRLLHFAWIVPSAGLIGLALALLGVPQPYGALLSFVLGWAWAASATWYFVTCPLLGGR